MTKGTGIFLLILAIIFAPFIGIPLAIFFGIAALIAHFSKPISSLTPEDQERLKRINKNQ